MKGSFMYPRLLPIIILVFSPLALYAAKPLPPVQISVAPAQAGLAAGDIKPGDVVEFKVIARSMMDSPEMRVTVELTGGAELVSGETSWAGPMAKGEEKTLLFSVRAPKKGNAKIKASMETTATEGAAFRAHARYSLGEDVNAQKPGPARPVKKDGKGRDVIEYR